MSVILKQIGTLIDQLNNDELVQIQKAVQALLEAREDEQQEHQEQFTAGGLSSTLPSHTHDRSRGYIEEKIIRGCGPYCYLRYRDGKTQRSLYLGKSGTRIRSGRGGSAGEGITVNTVAWSDPSGYWHKVTTPDTLPKPGHEILGCFLMESPRVARVFMTHREDNLFHLPIYHSMIGQDQLIAWRQLPPSPLLDDSRWTPGDTLPTELGDYLIYFPAEKRICQAVYIGQRTPASNPRQETWLMLEDNYMLAQDEVSYYMLMPEPPVK